MEYSENDKKVIIANVMKKNGLTSVDMAPLLSKRMTNTTKIRNSFSTSNLPYSKIITFFEPSLEQVDPLNIDGLEYNSGTFLECLLTIYRPESIYNNLGDFDFDKFNKSLVKTNFLLIEKNGKYYVHGDGNHRCLSLLFASYLQKIKLEKQNLPISMQKQFLSKFKINVPVVHLEHNDDLMTFLNNNFYTSFGDLEQDYINKLTGDKNYRSITYNKEANTYSMNYKGFKFFNKTNDEILNKMKQIEAIGCKNNLYYKNNYFTLTNKHIGVTNIPKKHLYQCDNAIEELQFPKTKFNYFIDTDYYEDTVNLHISNCFYTDDIKNIKEINNFLEKKLDILKVKNANEIFHPVNNLYEKKYKNISLGKALDIIETLHELEKLILSNEKKTQNKR